MTEKHEKSLKMAEHFFYALGPEEFWQVYLLMRDDAFECGASGTFFLAVADLAEKQFPDRFPKPCKHHWEHATINLERCTKCGITRIGGTPDPTYDPNR